MYILENNFEKKKNYYVVLSTLDSQHFEQLEVSPKELYYSIFVRENNLVILMILKNLL